LDVGGGRRRNERRREVGRKEERGRKGRRDEKQDGRKYNKPHRHQ
jgi:hypothetical protein